MPRLPSRSRMRRVIVVLPAPEGEDRTRSRPRLMPNGEPPTDRLLDVLHLLAQLLDRGLEAETDARQGDVAGFRAQGVGLAVELLAEEIEAAADRRAFAQEVAGGGEMRLQAIELLANIGLGDEQRRLLRQALLGQARRGLEQR